MKTVAAHADTDGAGDERQQTSMAVQSMTGAPVAGESDGMALTWVLVADGARARLLSLQEGEYVPRQIRAFSNAMGRMPGRELERDRRPRTYDRFGRGRHAIEPRTSTRDKCTARFAALLHSTLERGCVEHRYSDLVLIAPPHFLGLLNATLDKRVRARVALEMPKDLTHADAGTIGARLRESLRGTGT